MSQTNYFTYNIIDTLYFNQPTGNELTKLYGIENTFKRRNPTEYNSMSQQEKLDYDAQEKRFIQGVINKYIIDDYGENGSYIGIDTEYHNQFVNADPNDDLTYAYFRSNIKKGIELPDMVSNINGTHNYKLISAKDIDFDNVILPNSAISREFNWGSFDRNRRWGDKPIHINNAFELLNVVDYLLCACDNLWNELYKLKYSVNEGVEIWFTKDVADNVLIHSSNQLVVQDFQINSSRTERTKMITYLDPFKYYTSLNNNIENNFGIVTNFYKIADDLDNLTFDRKIIDTSGKNIILMNILPQSKLIGEYVSTLSQNINGTLQQIYTYKIGNELKIYPGSRIDTFISDRNVYTIANELIDFENKRFKNETYFKSDSANNEYSKLYLEFLNSERLNLSNDNNIKNPYFIYYINNVNKKIIIAYSYEGSDKSNVDEIKNKIANINTLPSYEFYDFDNNALDDQVHTSSINGQTYISPKFYVLTDEFFSTLEVVTPNSKKFSSSSKSILIYYYKNNNNLACDITRFDKNGELVHIEAENDPLQSTSLAYNYFRYNIPDSQDITFKFDATYIALDSTPTGNPLDIKLDDEYKDIMLYHPENVTTNEEASKYYELTDVESSGLFNRKFEQFNRDSFISKKNNYTSTDAKSGLYKHTWMKYDNPYRLNVTIDHDELINQSISSDVVNTEINNIINNNELVLTSYNTYTFNHTLADDVEEVKLNLRFHIDETSKVKATECVIPININRIYNPTINYYTYQAVKLEYSNYSNIEYTYNSGSEKITLSKIYEKTFRKYDNSDLSKIPNLCKIMSGSDITSLDDLQLQRSYDNVFNNTCFEFTYHPRYNFINLLGGWYTEEYIPKNNRGFAAAQLRYDNSSIPVILKSTNVNNVEYYTNHLYFFNLNGFSRKYRLHGNNNTVPDNINIGTDEQLRKTIWGEFDLISVASEIDNKSINEQLKIKLVDDAQLTYICAHNNEDSSEYVWEENNNNFNSGIVLDEGSYIIKTLPIDICKTTYTVQCNLNYDSVNPPKFTYYLPIAYAYINSSTFFPPQNTIPSGIVPDINDDVEKTKYKMYMDCWNDTSNYHPITMSLKLFNNTVKSNPYYYESNEAVMKFNILRSEIQTNVISVSGIEDKWIYVAKNSKYYLSDFIKVVPSSDAVDLYPSGSYFYYDDNYHTHIVNEIFANTSRPSLGSNHNSHYENTYINTLQSGQIFEKLTPPDSESSKKQALIPYPIFFKQNERNDDVVEFSSTLYDYDIYRLSDINKLAIQNIICNKFKLNSSGEILDNEIQGIYTNTSYYTLQFGGDSISNSQYLSNFGDDDSFNIMYYHIQHGNFNGSKNYNGATSGTSRTNTFICPIIREKIQDNGNQLPELYSTVTYNEKEYEFFEFRYEDVYEVKLEDGVWTITSIAPNANTSCKESYELQLRLFLKNDEEDFISNLSFYEIYYEN